MATQAIDATIFASTHPDIAKRTSVSGLIFSVAMLLLGILIFASTFEVTDRSSTLSMLLMVLGTAFFLLGIFRLFWKSKEVVYIPTGSITKERSVFFDLKHMGKLKEMIEKGQLSIEEGVKSEGSGNVRLDVILSQDNKFAAVQLFQFVPYTYTPVTSVHYYTGNGTEPAPLLRMSVPVFHCQLSETENQKSYDHCQHYQPEGVPSGHQPCH